MKKKQTILLLLVMSAIMAGCSGKRSPYVYSNQTRLVKPNKDYNKSFEDKNISITFQVREKKIHFTLKNNTSETISILWSKAFYIDSYGNRHKAVGRDSLFSTNMGKPNPTSIEAGGKTKDLFVPIDNVKSTEEWTWEVKPLFNLKDKDALDNKGKDFSVILPMNVGGEEIGYIFQFDIYNVAPQRIIIN